MMHVNNDTGDRYFITCDLLNTSLQPAKPFLKATQGQILILFSIWRKDRDQEIKNEGLTSWQVEGHGA